MVLLSRRGALAECLDEVPGVRIGLETKPYEPIPNNIYRTTGDGAKARSRDAVPSSQTQGFDCHA